MSFKNKQSTRKRSTLVLFCGLPGSGKTTLARKLAQEMPAIRLCPDEWKASLSINFFDEEARGRLEERLIDLAWELLTLGQDVILEFGFWGRSERDALRETARKHNIRIELYYLNVPFDELIRRLEIRNVSGGHGTVPLTRAQMEGYAKRFQTPDSVELALFTRTVIHSPQE